MQPFGDEHPSGVYAARRDALRAALAGAPALLFAGEAQPRNYEANRHPFRASSHFLHLVGLGIEGAVLEVGSHRDVLYVPRPSVDDAVWHGPAVARDALGSRLALDVEWLDALPTRTRKHAFLTRPALDATTRARQAEWLAQGASVGDDRLARALVACRLRHDDHAIAELRRAARTTAAAHALGMATALPGRTTSDVRAAMEAHFIAAGMTTAYGSIVTPHGEVLHAPPSHRTLRHDDLLLCDVGAETASGYAADVTRTYPVTGRFDTVARELYEAVLGAQRAAIHAARPGMRFRVVHRTAMRAMAEALVGIGLLRGDVDERVADGSVALFFPHGIGHLLGLDVHDLEDLGDRAGYAAGRERTMSGNLRYLRLDRPLEAGMLVTIEPGFYLMPSLLSDPGELAERAHLLDREKLAQLEGLRGIRIEDDVLVTPEGAEVLSRDLPKALDEVEALLREG